MLIRRLVIASFIAGAASAQAGTIGTQSTQSAQPANVVNGWTTGNGTDILGSGVLQGGNLNLVAGVTHSADASLTDILYGKVAGSVQQVDGQTKLFFQRGIEANYLLASGHGILAATAGVGKSVVADTNGAIISDGMTKAPGMAGGGNNTSGGNGGGGSTGAGGGSTGAGAGSGGTGGGFSGIPGATPATMPGNAPGLPQQGSGIGNGGLNGNGGGIGAGSGGGFGNVGNIGNIGNDEAVEVPEPSSIALMLLGMAGAGALSRRRR